MKGGVYIHIPYCARRCTYCAFVSGAPHDTMPQYIMALKREMEIRLNKADLISTIYIGGGTPSVLYRGAIADILSFIFSHASVSSDAEITVECNPDSVTREFVEELLSSKVNRVSVGLQTDNDELLKKVNRPHNRMGFLRAWDLLSPIQNKSLDLMLGLPNQTKADLMSSLSLAVSLKAPHISLYALKSEEGTPLFNSGFVEDEDFEAELYEEAYRFLQKSGYSRYEVSNFCLGNMYSRHNFSYWDLTEYYGFGVSAHSFLGGFRLANTDNINKYILYFLGKDIDKKISGGETQAFGIRAQADGYKMEIDNDRTNSDKPKINGYICFSPVTEATDVRGDSAEEYIMLSLRTSRGLDLDRLRSYGVDLIKTKGAIIDKLISSGFLVRKGNRLILSDDAFFVMNSVITELL